MIQPSPEELKAAFQKIEASSPLAASDDSRQSETIYDIVKSLPEASTYHRLLEQHPNLIELLADASNGEYTLFLPVDAAWEREPGLAERVADTPEAGVLSMHISESFINEAYLRSMTNVPTIYAPNTCNGPQTFSVRLTERGQEIGKSGRFTQPSIRASNGIIHSIDEVIHPPHSLLTALRDRSNYSILLRAMRESGFEDDLAANSGKGGTLFAPSNQAFASLGPDALHFLTEEDGGKTYLRALLKLHFCPGSTFYTNFLWPQNTGGPRRTSADKDRILKGKIKMELPSSLTTGGEPMNLAISITRYMSLITMAVTSAPVVEQDIGGNDYVAQGINDVLLPGGVVGKGSQDVISTIRNAFGPFI
ncbi:hypothetical protein NLG97_g2948 [Lecanicillium saksenae]|uniref:Uncharacterized protein n=1 Tax=Lecanicillium saksenae TaxID=468837 RepID=A0ACC1R3H9_9HYPO|nr:hypothetical protein NLG97_g2948 [Lecanicillium saksenae]